MPSTNYIPVTAWYRLDKSKKTWTFNHIQRNHIEFVNMEPCPDVKVPGSVQEGWKNDKWKLEHGFLVNGVYKDNIMEVEAK